MKHKITFKLKDTGETFTLWFNFNESGNHRNCVKMQRYKNAEFIPVEIELLEHKIMFSGDVEEEAAKKVEEMITAANLTVCLNQQIGL